MQRLARLVPVLLVMATGVVLAPSSADASTPPPGGCASVYIAGARGSGESANNHGGFGRPVGEAVDVLVGGLGNKYSIALAPVDYPAASVPWSLATGYDSYKLSVNVGVSALSAQLETQAVRCPKQRFVVLGYSQGADVVGSTLRSMMSSNALDTTVLARIAGVVVFGDPWFRPGDGPNVDYTLHGPKPYDPALMGIFPRIAGGDRTDTGVFSLPKLAGKVRSYCLQGDGVCNASQKNLQGVLSSTWPHRNYTDSYTFKAAQFLAPLTREAVRAANRTPLIGTGSISAGANHTCAVTYGAVKCWGYNLNGELGNGTTSPSSTPVSVVGLGSGVAAVSAGSMHTCALTTGGAVKCWGYNGYGELGDGTTTSSTKPVDVVGLGSGVAAVSAGGMHTCAVTTKGAVKCWGNNASGQLGDGVGTSSTKPMDVAGLGSGVASVSAGGLHTCAVTANGAVLCWGANLHGQLGSATSHSDKSTTPLNVVGLGSGVATVSTGTFHTCALTTGGAVKCWGDNTYGGLGNGATTSSVTPVGVIGLGSGVFGISAGHQSTCAVTTGGATGCWGYNLTGQLGNGTNTDSTTSVGVIGVGSGVAAVSAGYLHACGVTTFGEIKCWGNNPFGELGNGTTTNSNTPVVVIGLS